MKKFYLSHNSLYDIKFASNFSLKSHKPLTIILQFDDTGLSL